MHVCMHASIRAYVKQNLSNSNSDSVGLLRTKRQLSRTAYTRSLFYSSSCSWCQAFCRNYFFYTHYCEFINSVFDLDAIADHELGFFNTMLMDRDSELRTVVWGPETAIFIQFCSVPWTHLSVCYFIFSDCLMEQGCEQSVQPASCFSHILVIHASAVLFYTAKQKYKQENVWEAAQRHKC